MVLVAVFLLGNLWFHLVEAILHCVNRRPPVIGSHRLGIRFPRMRWARDMIDRQIQEKGLLITNERSFCLDHHVAV